MKVETFMLGGGGELNDHCAPPQEGGEEKTEGGDDPGTSAGENTLDKDWTLLMQAWDDMIAATQLKPKANFNLSTELCDQVNTALYHLARHETLIAGKMDRAECLKLLDGLKPGDGAMVSSITQTRALHQKNSPARDVTCMACHQSVADPTLHTRIHTDEGFNQARGNNIAPKVHRFKSIAGPGQEDHKQLSQVHGVQQHPPGMLHHPGKVSPQKHGKEVPHLIKEDLAEWEYEVEKPRGEGGGSRFPPIQQRPILGKAQ